MNREELLELAVSLSEQGDPYGALLQEQLQPKTTGLLRRQRLRELQAQVLGALPRGVGLTWEDGVVSKLSLSPRQPGAVSEWLPAALKHQALSRLQVVSVGHCAALSEAMACLSALPDSVETISVCVWRPNRQEQPLSLSAEDLSAIATRPALKQLDVVAGEIALPPMAMASLTTLSLRGRWVTNIDALVRAELPALRSLSLHGRGFGDAFCSRLAALPGLAALQVLDLSHAHITDVGGTQLAAQADALRHLQLNLLGNALSPSCAQAVAAALPQASLGAQRTAEDPEFQQDEDEMPT